MGPTATFRLDDCQSTGAARQAASNVVRQRNHLKVKRRADTGRDMATGGACYDRIAFPRFRFAGSAAASVVRIRSSSSPADS